MPSVVFPAVCQKKRLCLISDHIEAVISLIPVLAQQRKRRKPESYEKVFEVCGKAAAAYIEAFCEGDISGMLSCCAVESYVDHYQLTRELERTDAVAPFILRDIPPSSPFARKMSISVRRAVLADMIKKQYLSFIGSDLLYGEEGSTGGLSITNYASAEDMMEAVFPAVRPEMADGLSRIILVWLTV